MPKKPLNNRLSRNFHRTFKPERHYINSLLRFAASGKSGTFQEISAETGIPTGESTGKVPAILDYCVGMGLVVQKQERSIIKKPELTDFGRIVMLEDPFLKTDISQWIAHFNMCNKVTGADVWYYVFWKEYHSLGLKFTREFLDDLLCTMYKTTKSGIIGPLIGMYEDDAAFKKCGALKNKGQMIERTKTPISNEMARGIGAWIIQIIEDNFKTQKQVSITELENQTGWLTLSGWVGSEVATVLELIERKGMIKVDRHMNPWLIQAIISCQEGWRNIFTDLI